MRDLIKCETVNPDTEIKVSAISVTDLDNREMGDVIRRVFLSKEILKSALTENRPDYHEHPEKAHTYFLYNTPATDHNGDDIVCDTLVVRLDYNSDFVQNNTPLCWL